LSSSSSLSLSSSPDVGVVITFKEVISSQVAQTFSLKLPSGVGDDASVIAAVREQVVAATISAMASANGGVMPTSVTIVPTTVTATDGSVALTLRVTTIFSTTVNSTAVVSRQEYAADAGTATSAAIKRAAGGPVVAAAASALTTVAQLSAASTDALANGTTLTGSPPSSLAARVMNASIAALTLAGKTKEAALVNSTLVLSPTVQVSVAPVTVSSPMGIATNESKSLGVTAGESSSALNVAGGSTSAVFAVLTAAAVYGAMRSRLRTGHSLTSATPPKVPRSYSKSLPVTTNPLHSEKITKRKSRTAKEATPSHSASSPQLPAESGQGVPEIPDL
jgi:hypothetical protein